jgi:hypothetical protein
MFGAVAASSATTAPWRTDRVAEDLVRDRRDHLSERTRARVAAIASAGTFYSLITDVLQVPGPRSRARGPLL